MFLFSSSAEPSQQVCRLQSAHLPSLVATPWAYYSERFTMSSNDYTLTGHLPRYFMSNISLEKMLSFKPLDVQLKLAVNNLFNEDYLSVLSRPMPGINFEFFIGITPKFGKSRK